MLQMVNTDQRDWWVVAMESSLDDQFRADISHEYGLIHTVPKSLLSEKTEVFYLPQVISLGPYHFRGEEKPHDQMELLKSEVARHFHRKLIRGSDSRERMESGLNSVVESFKNQEKEIKGSYARKFEVSGEVCAWMIARDACFVLQVLERFGKDEAAQEKVSDFVDSILSRKRHHPLLPEIVKDMLKMENQLPFWALQEIRPDIVDWFESALINLSPIEVANMGDTRLYKKISLLQLLHDYIVDRPIPILLLPSTFSDRRVNTKESGTKGWLPVLVYVIILLVFSPFVFIIFIILVIHEFVSPKWKITEHAATIEELKRAGVKFKKLEGEERGISHIRFNESDSTLYLPQFKVDNRSEVILRNLIALEICSQEEEKPVTRYIILMNDLINTSVDVAILRREGIITSKLGSDEEIAQFWNSMVTSTEMPRYEPIDNAVSSIDRYRKKWWKVLWAQFIMAYCSKPWLFLSLLAGVLLLLLTIVQVVCLFASCQVMKK